MPTPSRLSAVRGRPACRLKYCRRLVCEPLEDRRQLSIVYVDDSATGLDDGTSWANAYTDLQSALAAAIPRQEIRVAQGTYKPTPGTDRTASFVLRNQLSVVGGYAGYGASNPDARDVALYPTILSGDIGMPGSTLDNSYQVVVGGGTDSTAVLDGFTITSGNADGESPHDAGGGVYNHLSSPTLTNCTLTANSAWSGGGMSNSSSSPTLTNCIFIGNTASDSGGGMANTSSSPALTNCMFIANSASTSGGGMCSVAMSRPTLTNCILWGNMAPNSSQIDHSDGGAPVITYSDVQGGYTGTGNIDQDPQFVRAPSTGPDDTWGTPDDDYGDLRLRPFSPAVDAGNNSAVPTGITTDLAGHPRFGDVPTVVDTGAGAAPRVDLGAYEAVASLDVEAGGPYAVLEGREMALHADGASAQPGTLLFEWDFDADGQYDDAVGPTPAFSAAVLSGPVTLTIGVRLTDSTLASITDTAVLVVAAEEALVDDTATGLNHGTSWADAYTDLQSALAMSARGQVIRVAQGTYRPTAGTNRGASFVLRSGVAVYGGYAGCGATDPFARDPSQYVTVLSGDIGAAGETWDNSYHVVVGSGADAAAALDGFTITAGNADGESSYSYNYGGGMYNDSSSPTLTNCTFTANAAYYGGGMCNEYSSSPALTNCTFTANRAWSGGGMCSEYSSSPALTNCTFTGNSANYYGGGMYNYSSSPALTNCTFTANSANYWGGGVCNWSSSPTLAGCTFTTNYGGGMYNCELSSPTLTNCAFTANSASYGGGMYNWSSSPTVTNCSFTANSASYGGGMCNRYSLSPTVTNCTFTANSASDSGGGMYNYSSSPTVTNCSFTANSTSYGGGMHNHGSSPTLTNCTFTVNSASYGGGMYNVELSLPTLTNCILWGTIVPDSRQIDNSGGGTAVVTYSDVQGGYTGTGNIDLDPQFVRTPGPGPDGAWCTSDDDFGDLQLGLRSPCIDAGKNSAVPPGATTDLAGNPRFVDVPAVPDTGSDTPPIVDMGAFESPRLLIAGTDGSDDFALSLTTDHASIQILSPGESNTYPVGAITSLFFTGGAGDDRLAVNFANGNPVPTGGLAYDGEASTDTLRIVALGSDATLSATQVIVGTAAPITLSNVEGTSFALGSGRLVKSGHGTAVLCGPSEYSGGTLVTGGTLAATGADALPAGGALTIDAGGTVVLASGLSAAAPATVARTLAPTATSPSADRPVVVHEPRLPRTGTAGGENTEGGGETPFLWRRRASGTLDLRRAGTPAQPSGLSVSPPATTLGDAVFQAARQRAFHDQLSWLWASEQPRFARRSTKTDASLPVVVDQLLATAWR